MRVTDHKRLGSGSEKSDRRDDDGDYTIGTEAIVLCPILGSAGRGDGRSSARPQSDLSTLSPEARIGEAEGLARAIDLNVVHKGIVRVQRPRAATLFGTGKVEELAGLVTAEDAGLVVVDHPLSPVQQRNLEKAWSTKVLDRTGLILEIFGRRARTKEGRLQVELAHLTYQRSRLVRSWTHLERQRGGFGFLGGPGETQIEADRRVIQDRIASLRKELETVTRTRGLHRESRRRVPYPIVALVGYTNAGKSTLFNRITGAGVMAEDMLFATLDPTMRETELPKGSKVILSDTVGFISDLPTTLVAAFRATLEEVIEADVILHVRDVAHDDSEAQAAEVEQVLQQLGIDEETRRRKLFEVWNKIDLLDSEALERCKNEAVRKSDRVQCVSATTGEGVDALLAFIEERISATHETLEFTLTTAAGALDHWIHENSEVLEREFDGESSLSYRVRIPKAKKATLMSRLAKAAA